MLDDKDLQKMFSAPAKKKSKLLRIALSYIGTFAGIFIIVFVLVNFSALFNIIDY